VTADRLPNAIEGVICENCGKQGLSEVEYHNQMMRPDSTWRCPVCRQEAEWDDARYEAGLDEGNMLHFQEDKDEEPAELPKMFQLPLSEVDLVLVGVMAGLLKASVSDSPVSQIAGQMMLDHMVQGVGVDAVKEDANRIIDKVNQLLGRPKCPDCGGYHG